MQVDEVLITRENFKRAPKGTTVLLIDKELFIKLTPEKTGRDVNDDTLLFHNLVFQHGINLLRSRRLRFGYSQRTDLKQFTTWLFERGVRFSDFYLRPGGYFFTPFLLINIIFIAIVVVAVLSASMISQVLWHMLQCVLAINVAITIYLSENPKDLIRVFSWPAIIGTNL
jgi:hypothetical protein